MLRLLSLPLKCRPQHRKFTSAFDRSCRAFQRDIVDLGDDPFYRARIYAEMVNSMILPATAFHHKSDVGKIACGFDSEVPALIFTPCSIFLGRVVNLPIVCEIDLHSHVDDRVCRAAERIPVHGTPFTTGKEIRIRTDGLGFEDSILHGDVALINGRPRGDVIGIIERPRGSCYC
jgi:hypothetical protein